MSKELQIKFDHISKHLEDALQGLLFEDDPLAIRVMAASVEIETLHINDLNDLPTWLKSDIEKLTDLVDDQVTHDNAVAFAKLLLDLFLRVEIFRNSEALKKEAGDE